MVKPGKQDIINEFDKFSENCFVCDYGTGIKKMLAYIREYIEANVKKIEDLEAITVVLESKRSKKDGYRKILKNFYDYLKNTHRDWDLTNPFADFRFFDNPVERQLEIAKYLHEAHTTSEIAEHFKIDARTVRSDLDALAKGVQLLDYHIKADCKKDGLKKYYHTTLHPIFLTLNITEVYALTVYLHNLIKDDDPNKYIFDYLENTVYSQLSDYGKSIINKDNRFSPKDLRYIHDNILAEGREGCLMYLFKSGQTATVEYVEKRIFKSVRARLRLGHDRAVSLVDENDNLIAENLDINEINIVPGSFDYQ